jgi:hypothetical protein
MTILGVLGFAAILFVVCCSYAIGLRLLEGVDDE